MAFDTENDLEFTRKVTKNDWTMDLDRVQNFNLQKLRILSKIQFERLIANFEPKSGEENPFDDVSDESKDFISRLLKSRPEDRLSAEDCFEHPWFQKNLAKAERDIGEKVLDAERSRPVRFFQFLLSQI